MNKVYLFITVLTVSVFPYFIHPMHSNADKEYKNSLVRGMAAAYPGIMQKSGHQEQDDACALMPPLITLAALGEALFNKDFARELSSFRTEEGSVLKYQIACLLLKGIMKGNISPEEIPYTWQKIQLIFSCAMPPVDTVLSCHPVDLFKNHLIAYERQFAEFENSDLPLVIRRELLNSFCSKVEPTLYNRCFSKVALMKTKFIKGLGGDLEKEIPQELIVYGIPGKLYAQKHREVSFLAASSGLAVINGLFLLNMYLVIPEVEDARVMYAELTQQFFDTLTHSESTGYELLNRHRDHLLQLARFGMRATRLILQIIGPTAVGSWSFMASGIYLFGEGPFVPALYRLPLSEEEESSNRLKRSLCACLGFPAGFIGTYALLKMGK